MTPLIGTLHCIWFFHHFILCYGIISTVFHHASASSANLEHSTLTGRHRRLSSLFQTKWILMHISWVHCFCHSHTLRTQKDRVSVECQFSLFFFLEKKKNKEIEREKPSDFAYFFGRRLQLHVHVMLMLLLFVVCWCKMRNTSKKTLVAFTDVNVIRGGGRCLYALGQRHCSVSKPLDSICS